MEIKLDFPFTPVFLNNHIAKERYVVNQGGTWSSKTMSILQVLALKAITERRKDKKPVKITVTGQDLQHLKDGAILDFANIVSSSELLQSMILKYNRSEQTYYFKNGNQLHFKCFENAQDAKSGKRDFLFVNEANGVPFPIYDKLEERTDRQVFIDYNPDIRFWVHEKVLPLDNSVLFISNCFDHNPFTPEAIKRNIIRKGEKDNNYKKVYGYGITGKIEGLVFKNTEIIKRFPRNAKKVAYGLDFGYTNHPTALVKGGLIYGEVVARCLIYEKGLTNPDIAKEMRRLRVPKTAEIYADSAEPKSIAELRKLGFNVIAAKKGPDSIRFGIDTLNSYPFINITEDSENMITEFNSYKWKEDKNGNPLNQPVDAYNHAIDALRYLAIMKWASIQKKRGTRKVKIIR